MGGEGDGTGEEDGGDDVGADLDAWLTVTAEAVAREGTGSLASDRGTLRGPRFISPFSIFNWGDQEAREMKYEQILVGRFWFTYLSIFVFLLLLIWDFSPRIRGQ
jgi:hypothetical protein